MDILLINPNVSPEAIYGKKFKKLGASQPPLGECYIAAMLLANGFDVDILDSNILGMTDEEVCRAINDRKPPIVGLYASTMAYNRVKHLAGRIKSECADIPVILGGPHLQGVGAESIDCPEFDFGVVSEGEITTLEFMRAFKGDGDYAAIHGLLWKKDGQVVANAPRKLHPDLDDFPHPARHLLPSLSRYHLKAMITKHHPATHILTSRGCPFNCMFCNRFFGKKVRYHSAEYVVDEMQDLLENHGIREIAIGDDTFLVNHERVYRICELIKERGLKVAWSCNMNVKTADLDILKAIKNAGCWLIQPGIESGNQRILDIIDKPVKLDHALKVAGWAHEVGLKMKPSFIIGHPGETAESIDDTINFAIKMRAHFPAFALMTPFPGTRLWNEAEKWGEFEKGDYDSLVPAANASFVPNGLTAEYLKKRHSAAYRQVYLRPDMVWRHLSSIRSFRDVQKLWHAAVAVLQ